MSVGNVGVILNVLNVVRPRSKSSFHVRFCAEGSGKKVELDKLGEEIYFYLDNHDALPNNAELWDTVDVLLKGFPVFHFQVTKNEGKVELSTHILETNEKIAEAVDAIFREGYKLGANYTLIINP
ncbi:MAG: hypothetical protein V1744_00090 [Candidatus Altiarchaeota archaeon]